MLQAEDLLKRVSETCRKLAPANQCGDRNTAALGAAGPPLTFTPPTITQRLGQLTGAIESYTAAPTAWQLEQIKALQPMLNESGAAARKLAQDDLPALNKAMNEAGVPHIAVPRAGRAADASGSPEEQEEPEIEEIPPVPIG